MVILDRTPFYAESGGQVGDRGLLTAAGLEFVVYDTQKQGGAVIGHIGKVTKGILQVGDQVTAQIDTKLRLATALNHSATHLLHAALRRTLGGHVTQKGSAVGPERLRFDFTHFKPVSKEQLRAIEILVNQEIRANHLVETRIMSLADAKTMGAMALFGEKYANQVRVLCMGDFSTELCGGTHVNALGNIGLFRIISETGVAAGVRRIEAVTGAKAVDVMLQESERLQRIADLLRGSREDVEQRLGQLLEQLRDLERDLEQLKTKQANTAKTDLLSQAQEIDGVRMLAAIMETADAKVLRETLDRLKEHLAPAVIALASVNEGKVNLAVGVTKDLVDRLNAGDLIKLMAGKVGGKGGGRPDMAQAGGNNPAALPEALALVKPWVQERLRS